MTSIMEYDVFLSVILENMP